MKFSDSMVDLQRERFQGEVNGRPVDLYTLRNQQGMTVRISNYGARIQQVLVPDRAGEMADVALGYGSLADLRQDGAWLGAFVGRYANRIGGAQLTLDGQNYALSANDGVNTLHGGARGCGMQVFDVTHVAEGRLTLSYRFRTEDDGFPGAVDLKLSYAVDAQNALVVDWTAHAQDQLTVASFTSHAYFNLSGVARSTVLDHIVSIYADGVLETGDGLIPTGKVLPVEGTPFDLRQPQALAQSQTGGQYDHYCVGNHLPGHAGLALQARVSHPASGRTLETWSTEPGLQLYTGGMLGSAGASQPLPDKHGLPFARNGGLCIEPSAYPDAPHHPHFPSTCLRPGELRMGRIVYRFGLMPG